MDNSVLMINESQIRRDRNKFIFLFSIIPINIAITNIIGTAWSFLTTIEKKSTVLGLFLEYFIMVLVSILLEFVFYKLLALKLGRANLKLYNICLILLHTVLTFVILAIWIML